jgi:peptidyl-prolyl cis-trans isomerase SurA
LPVRAERVSLDGVAAVVDGSPILLSDLEELRQAFSAQRPAFASRPAETQRQEVLDRIIDEKVIVAKAKQDTLLRISEKDVAARAEESFVRAVQQQGGEKALELALRQTMGMSLGQFKARLQDQVRDQMYRQRLQMKYVGDPEPSQLQVREFFAHYRDSLPVQKDGMRLSHIQWRIKANAVIDAKARTRAQSLISRLDQGESFAALAKEHSDDPSGKEGGDLGYTKKGTLDPDFEKGAYSLDAGDYSARPVRTRFGYHLIRLTSKKDNEIRTSHILIQVIPSAEDSVRARSFLDSLRSTLKTTEEFAAAARKFSEDRKSKELGGDLGWFPKDQLDPSYKEAVDSLPEGGVSEPLLIGDSYHLFRVDRKATERHLTLEEDYPQVALFAKEWLINQKLADWVKKWRKQVHVENRLGRFRALDAAAVSGENDGEEPDPTPN